MRIQPLLLSHLWKSTQNTISLRQDLFFRYFSIVVERCHDQCKLKEERVSWRLPVSESKPMVGSRAAGRWAGITVEQ